MSLLESMPGNLRIFQFGPITLCKPVCDSDRWPKPPIWSEDLPPIRELLTEEEFEELLRRMVQVVPNGPLLDRRLPSKN